MRYGRRTLAIRKDAQQSMPNNIRLYTADILLLRAQYYSLDIVLVPKVQYDQLLLGFQLQGQPHAEEDLHHRTHLLQLTREFL